ncbi:MAG: N-acetyl-gamma-glutamyl-phosphate reductase [Candidatus Omnitrophica bacterium]|nr:N-acetyl-gamma-glutamyl-phosphate reductase [Candidatus Omnitrophota bacterium]
MIMKKVGVLGVTGYVGREVVNCLVRHRQVIISELASRNIEPVQYSQMYPEFSGVIDIECKLINIDRIAETCDVVFLALPHTVSMEYVPLLLKKGVKVIDLSADYRINKESYNKWYKIEHLDPANLDKSVYGLPEINREKIKKAKLIANPGCYPTSVILGLLPIGGSLADPGVNIISDSKSGASGAGKKADVALSFTEVNENLRCYKADEHQHIPEIEQILSKKIGKEITVHFAPHLLPVKRGIMSTIYVTGLKEKDLVQAYEKYEKFYEKEPFVRVREKGVLPELSNVVNTNFCDIGIKVSRGMLIIVSVIDNLLKGAAGQAVQNMNIMCGFDESEGLK